MSHDTWFLPIGCFSIIIKHTSVLRNYPGGEDAFERAYHPQRRSDAHYQVIAFSKPQVDVVLQRLAQAGLQLGEDLALASERGRPLVPCHEIGFWADGTGGGCRWKVGVDPGPLASYPVEDGPAPIARSGRPVASLDVPDAGLAIAVREAFGAVDGWDEYLCAFRGPWGFELAAFRYEWLGEVPDDWFDDDGDLLPEHVGPDGDIQLPATLWGQPVVAHRHGGFIGEFQPVSNGGEVQISDCSAPMVEAALEVVGWPTEALADVQAALRQLGASGNLQCAPSTGAVAPPGVIGSA